MKTRKLRARGPGLFVVGLLLLAHSMGWPQITDQTSVMNGSRTPNASHSPLGSDINEPGSPFPDTSAARRNDERQRRIVSDTQRLLTLATQLKAEVASSGTQTPTPEMLRQMDDIEKLAKSVKDKMRN